MARVFVVEDNPGLRETLESYLELEGHHVRSFSRLEGVAEALAMQGPDILLLDVMLPDGDGFVFARRLRQTSQVPLIFMTARTSESDRITGLEIGGDDYVIKPFSMKELMLRVRRVLARTQGPGGQEVSGGTQLMTWVLGNSPSRLVLDFSAHQATTGGRSLDLTSAEWKILAFLAENGGQVFSRERLLGACLDYSAEGSERTIDTHIKNLRAKLGTGEWIATVRGFGYRFDGTTS